jgi:hypothetical protein
MTPPLQEWQTDYRVSPEDFRRRVLLGETDSDNLDSAALASVGGLLSTGSPPSSVPGGGFVISVSLLGATPGGGFVISVSLLGATPEGGFVISVSLLGATPEGGFSINWGVGSTSNILASYT